MNAPKPLELTPRGLYLLQTIQNGRSESVPDSFLRPPKLIINKHSFICDTPTEFVVRHETTQPYKYVHRHFVGEIQETPGTGLMCLYYSVALSWNFWLHRLYVSGKIDIGTFDKKKIDTDNYEEVRRFKEECLFKGKHFLYETGEEAANIVNRVYDDIDTSNLNEKELHKKIDDYVTSLNAAYVMGEQLLLAGIRVMLYLKVHQLLSDSSIKCLPKICLLDFKKNEATYGATAELYRDKQDTNVDIQGDDDWLVIIRGGEHFSAVRVQNVPVFSIPYKPGKLGSIYKTVILSRNQSSPQTSSNILSLLDGDTPIILKNLVDMDSNPQGEVFYKGVGISMSSFRQVFLFEYNLALQRVNYKQKNDSKYIIPNSDNIIDVKKLQEDFFDTTHHTEASFVTWVHEQFYSNVNKRPVLQFRFLNIFENGTYNLEAFNSKSSSTFDSCTTSDPFFILVGKVSTPGLYYPITRQNIRFQSALVESVTRKYTLQPNTLQMTDAASASASVDVTTIEDESDTSTPATPAPTTSNTQGFTTVNLNDDDEKASLDGDDRVEIDAASSDKQTSSSESDSDDDEVESDNESPPSPIPAHKKQSSDILNTPTTTPTTPKNINISMMVNSKRIEESFIVHPDSVVSSFLDNFKKRYQLDAVGLSYYGKNLDLNTSFGDNGITHDDYVTVILSSSTPQPSKLSSGFGFMTSMATSAASSAAASAASAASAAKGAVTSFLLSATPLAPPQSTANLPKPPDTTTDISEPQLLISSNVVTSSTTQSPPSTLLETITQQTLLDVATAQPQQQTPIKHVDFFSILSSEPAAKKTISTSSKAQVPKSKSVSNAELFAMVSGKPAAKQTISKLSEIQPTSKQTVSKSSETQVPTRTSVSNANLFAMMSSKPAVKQTAYNSSETQVSKRTSVSNADLFAIVSGKPAATQTISKSSGTQVPQRTSVSNADLFAMVSGKPSAKQTVSKSSEVQPTVKQTVPKTSEAQAQKRTSVSNADLFAMMSGKPAAKQTASKSYATQPQQTKLHETQPKLPFTSTSSTLLETNPSKTPSASSAQLAKAAVLSSALPSATQILLPDKAIEVNAFYVSTDPDA